MARLTHISDAATHARKFSGGGKFSGPGFYFTDTGLADTRESAWSREGKITAPMITSDNVEYKSTITGEMITSRSTHREHLRRHGCIEVGTDAPKRKSRTVQAMERKKSLSRDLKTALDMYHQGFRNAPVARADFDASATPGAVSRSSTPTPALIT